MDGFGNSNSPKEYKYVDISVEKSETYYYKLQQIDNDGTFKYSKDVLVIVDVPKRYTLRQNFPNPFNPETRIEFTLPVKQFVLLKVYNMLGQLVLIMINEVKEAGNYSVTFNAADLPSGNYVYRLETPEYTAFRKMTLLK